MQFSTGSVTTKEFIKTIDRAGAIAFPDFLYPQTLSDLLSDLKTVSFICGFAKQPVTYGKHGVRQNLSTIEDLPARSSFRNLAEKIERTIGDALRDYNPAALSGLLHFSHVVLQRYPPCELGISAHRDGKSFINLVGILVLEGRGRFCLCDDRAGTNARVVSESPNTLIMMRAPGFLGADIQPFHFVDRITEERTILCMRQKARQDAP